MKNFSMTLLVSSLLMFGMASHSASARSLAAIKDAGTINIVTTPSDAPHSFLDPASNSLQGINIDVANEVAKQLGVTVKYVSVPFDGLVATLSSGRADFLSAPLFITEKRAQVVDFTVPMYGWGEGILVPDTSKNTYGSFQDLQGHRVGVLEGSVQYDILRAMKGTTVSAYPDYPSLLLELRSNRIDAALVDPPSVAYAILKDSITGLKQVEGYKPLEYWEIGGAVEKGNADLLNAINEVIQAMKADGRLHAILDKWGSADLESK